MKKTYKIKKLSCAHCALQIGESLSKIEGVKKAKVNFMLSRLSLELDEGFDISKEEINTYIKKIEPDSELA